MRLRKKPWVIDELMNYTNLVVARPEEQQGKWLEAFNNQNPIHAEFGTGRGRFLIALAEKNPDLNYIALEQKQEVLIQGIRRANQLGITNIKFILGNANRLSEFFAEGELSRIYLNFVDPWPKNRHAKRRLTHHRYLEVYRGILTTGGEIHLKTDNEILFEFSLNETLAHNFLLKNICLNLYRDEENRFLHEQTDYELMYIKEGRPIYRVEIIEQP